MKRNDILNAIQELAYSQGFYGRLDKFGLDIRNLQRQVRQHHKAQDYQKRPAKIFEYPNHQIPAEY